MKVKKTYTIEQAKRKLEHYCAYQERCHQEVQRKLQSMHMIPEAIDVIIVHLLEHNFLNEERYAKAFVSGKFRIKHWGKQRLTLELKRKEVSKYNIDHALRTIEEEDYLHALDCLAEKKAATIKESNPYKKRKKLADYLLYRGWESYLVYDKVNALVK